MLSVVKDKVLMDDGHFFARTASLDAGTPYAEFIDGAWVRPEDPFDPWEDKVISWEEFEKRTSTRQ